MGKGPSASNVIALNTTLAGKLAKICSKLPHATWRITRAQYIRNRARLNAGLIFFYKLFNNLENFFNSSALSTQCPLPVLNNRRELVPESTYSRQGSCF